MYPFLLGTHYLTRLNLVQHRREIVKHVRKTVQFVAKFGTRVATVALAKRPLAIWWSMCQIRGCVAVSMIWYLRA
jgi:hypothetical protein